MAEEKIVFLDVEPWEEEKLKEYVKEEGIEAEVVFDSRSANEIDLETVKDATVLSVFIHSKLDREILERLDKLKFVVTRSTGFDHIDLDYCKQRGIVVCNIPDYGDNTVAEFTMLLILALVRKFNRVSRAIKKDVRIDPKQLRGNDLFGKTIGIVGAGRIGSYVAKLAHGFGMKILYYDIRKNETIESNYGAKKVELEELLKNSDIITLHLPLTKETRHIINSENIKLVKKGAFFVNTARGELVETKALVEALSNGVLSGVALDVIEGEKILKKEVDVIRKEPSYDELLSAFTGHVLLKFDNVILTPHIAYNTWEALERIVQKTVKTIKEYLNGNVELYNRVA